MPSGSLRVKVYAGVDPLSGKRHYLTETIPAGPTAADDAERARTRLQSQVDERRSPRTRATVDQLMDRYLSLLDVDETTRKGYEVSPSSLPTCNEPKCSRQASSSNDPSGTPEAPLKIFIHRS